MARENESNSPSYLMGYVRQSEYNNAEVIFWRTAETQKYVDLTLMEANHNPLAISNCLSLMESFYYNYRPLLDPKYANDIEGDFAKLWEKTRDVTRNYHAKIKKYGFAEGLKKCAIDFELLDEIKKLYYEKLITVRQIIGGGFPTKRSIDDITRLNITRKSAQLD